jgi:putative tricarboxylic transport membrane protein
MDRPPASRPDPAAIAIAGVLLALAAVILWDTMRLDIATTYGIGPKAMPYVVAAGLALLSAGNLALAWRADFPPRDELDLRAILLILGGLVAMIATIGLGGGFIAATTILFAATSAGFGRRAPHIDVPIGLALGLVIYLLFDKLLTLSLPAGPLERLL